ncbi:MAG: hypothetical protein WCT07_02130 [Candidatus Paceibacterota bacterium]|jgi:hypothetical protein
MKDCKNFTGVSEMVKEVNKSVKGVPDDPNGFTEHHRKPVSINGSKKDKRNISSIRRYKHNAWHSLFGVLPAPDIILLFHEYYEMYGIDYPKSPLFKEWCEGRANSTNAAIKITRAWYALFEGKNLSQIAEEINTYYLDPDYKILVGTERILKACLVLKST